VGRVHLLTAVRDVPFRAEGQRIEFEVPSIDLHEVVAVDFAV
jgi:hypothetical protein